MTIDASITVVIVAFNSGDWLLRSVQSCLRCAEITEILVCDNASSDTSLKAIAGFARVQIQTLTENFGFSTACNVGWRRVKTEFVLFLNPDCELQTGQLGQLMQLFASDSRAGIVSSQLVNEDASPQAPGLRRDPTPWRILAHFSGLARLFPQLAINICPELTAGVQSVDACSGALMLMRKSLLEQLEGFDEGYFLHCEDLDICRRTRALEKRVLVDTRVKVLHAKGTSSASVPGLVARAKLLGMQHYFEKFDAQTTNMPLRLVIRGVIWLRLYLQN